MTSSLKHPWKDGYYKLSTRNTNIFKVMGESVEIETLQGKIDLLSKGTWKFGDFGEAHPKLVQHTGRASYNVEMNLRNGLWVMKGILDEDGKTISIWTNNEYGSFELMSEDEYISFKNSGDPADAPPNHYKIKPAYDGKLIFISGAPGSGKSTCGLILSKVAGYVYYEADAFLMHVNPYIPPDVSEPSLATLKQKPLVNIPQDRIDAVTDGMEGLLPMLKGEDYNKSKLEIYYSALCKNIKAEKKRLGGDWVIAQAVPSRYFRDYIKKELGFGAIFVVLNMSKEDQKDRLSKRHVGDQSAVNWLSKMYDVFKPAEKDEEQAINIQITNNMSREEVVQKILDKLTK